MAPEPSRPARPIDAVVFDLDGVLIDSEPVWEEVRRALVAEHGGRWQPDSQQRLMGMSTAEWARYLSQELGVGLPPTTVAELVIAGMARRYQERLPFMDGAVEAVHRMASRWPLALASSSPRRLIDATLDRADLARFFAVSVSTEEVGRGKPAPDVYLEVARRLAMDPRSCAAVEDSSNGLRSAARAGLLVVAVPHPRYPPDPDAVAGAAAVLPGLRALTPELLEKLRGASAE
ncbi:MAG TPA: HAD family phosphatase [Terriglobales bacterium]|nr:HAD family phosphatase [Terriglobales bacterium]